jgi:hypothetical protein
MEDASAITTLPDDPQALKQIIFNHSRERDENARQRDERTSERDDWHVKFLRVETELLRLRKWYYGRRADRLQTPGDVADLLRPLYDLMVRRVLRTHVICTDDTVMPMLWPEKAKQVRTWVYVGVEHNPYNVFDFTLGRDRDGPATFLKDYKQILLADAHGGYDGVVVGNDIARAGCWAHGRRKFVDAEKTHPAIAAEAVGYVLNQWRELNVFTTDGAVPLDNNVSEREMKRICLNRKNSSFVGNERGGQTAAILSSLTSPGAPGPPAQHRPTTIFDSTADEFADDADQPTIRLAARAMAAGKFNSIG